MRIGSSDSNSKSKPQNSYENQNNELKKLHEERLKRQQQQQQSSQMLTESQQLIFSKQIKSSSSIQNKADKLPQNLFLNSILSDDRNIRDKPKAIALSSLFQDDPGNFATGISKNIKGVLMTTYGFVMDVLGQIAESGVPFVLVNDSSENGSGRVERNFCGYKNMSLVVPPRTQKGYGVFHTKLWLIKFPTFLRVVIATGNQHAEDWLIWLNAYWYHDFSLKGMKLSDYEEKKQKVQEPIKKHQDKEKNAKSEKQQNGNSSKSSVVSLLQDSDDEIQMYTAKDKAKQKQKQKQKEEQKQFSYEQDFRQTLKMVLKNMFPADFSLVKQTGIDIDKYDFSGVDVVLIPSIPGRHTEKTGEMEKYGMAKVKKVMKKLGPQIKKGTLSYNTSSLGLVDSNFLKQLYFTFLPSAESFSPSNYKVIYPTYQYITQKTCGQASVLFLKKQNYYKSDLRKEVFYHFEPSDRNPVKGAIPHLKTIVVENTDPKTEEEKNECVFFVGSHNMTKAAWGSYEKKLGILFLKMNKEKLLNFLPYRYPPRKYNESDKPFLRDL